MGRLNKVYITRTLIDLMDHLNFFALYGSMTDPVDV